MHERLTGMSMSHAFEELAQQLVQDGRNWIRSVISSLFSRACLRSAWIEDYLIRPRLPPAPGQTQTTPLEGDQTNANMEVVDNMLCIISSRIGLRDRTSFRAQRITWIGQVALMAYQENHPLQGRPGT